MAMADDVFKHMAWLHTLGLLETDIIIGIGLGMVSLEINGILVFDISRDLD